MVRAKLRDFIHSRFMFDGKLETLHDDASFLEKGILDSTGVVELLAFVEAEFKIQIEDPEIVPENLDSINSLCRFLERKGVSVVRS